MAKTAYEWMQALHLEEEPDHEFLRALNALEGKEVVGQPEDLPQVGLTPKELAEAVVLESVGEALKSIREQVGLTTRETGELLGISHARISQIERPDASLNLLTVARTAQKLGYRTKLVFESEVGGSSITVPVTF